MSLDSLKSVDKRATETDLKNIELLYRSAGRYFSDVLSELTLELTEEQVRSRYFRMSKDSRINGGPGKSFNYFFILAGKIQLNPKKSAELSWILSSK